MTITRSVAHWRNGRAAALAGLVLLVAGYTTAAAQDADICAKESGDTAIAACTRAINSDRHSGEVLARLHYNRGWEYDEKGEYDRAIRDYDEAIRINAKPNYYTNRGLTYANKGDLERAIRDYNAAIRLDAEHASAYNNRAVAYERQGDLDRALEDLDEAIRLDPNYKKAIENRARVREALKKGR